MSRFSDYRVQAPVRTVPSLLPGIDWKSIGAQAPEPVPIDYKGPTAPLPAADVVMFTWTDSEWSAMDHVFLHSTTAGDNQSTELIHKWLLYAKNAPGGSTPGGYLWGYYQLVDIAGVGQASHPTRVLLFKADAHLSHSPWLAGLVTMVQTIAADARPKLIYSIGTAGGASLSQNLGDVSVTNSGKLQLQLQENLASGLNGNTYTSTAFPSWSRMDGAQKLMMPLSKVATSSELEKVLENAKRSRDKGAESLKPFSLADLVNAPIDPNNLGKPKAVNFKDKPLLTTDYYYIAEGPTDYAALEMDDAVIGYAAQKAGTGYVFVRNISDTLVPAQTPQGKTIPDDAREAWSSAIYDQFGLYTSFNGALAAWGAIAAS
ncbi:MAG TPA: hypothetical protein VMU71_02745 [Terracidiphilus sp.]|jgi:hypothetical protein|nr:hypothetical protein [Terracidiphilus sp.]